MNKHFVLYHYWRSSSSWRVRWALELKGIQPELVHVGLLDGQSESESHLLRNPLGFVPVLEVNGKNLIESVAIIEWLEENFKRPQLYPGNSTKRAQIRALVEIINADTHPVQNLTVTDRLPENQRMEWKQFFIRKGLSAFQTVATSSAGRFSVGDEITAADLLLIPQCYNALRNEISLEEFPLLHRIYNAALETKECQASHPEQFKPAGG